MEKLGFTRIKKVNDPKLDKVLAILTSGMLGQGELNKKRAIVEVVLCLFGEDVWKSWINALHGEDYYIMQGITKP